MRATKFLEKFTDITIYHGYFPQCLMNTTNKTVFDLAYMNTVEYVFTQNELMDLLVNIKNFDFERFLLLSGIVYNKNFFESFIKYPIKKVLSSLHFYDLGQLWGYLRTKEELIKVFKDAGFDDVESDFLNRTKRIFWIRGC